MRMNRLSSTMLLSLLCAAVQTGCMGVSGSALNPSFPLVRHDAKRMMEEMRATPLPAQRPIVVLGGYFDPGFVAQGVANRLRHVLEMPPEVISITFFANGTFDECRAQVLREVEQAFPTNDPNWTREVDVVAISMGGVVARHAARDLGDGSRRLNIARLFTISTPHTGANLASLPTFDRRQLAMREDSDFMAELNEDSTSRDFPIYAYVRLDDAIVGVENAAPPGVVPWWVPNEPFQFAHLSAAEDPRILADIARRLRDESPIALSPPTPPPGVFQGDEAPPASPVPRRSRNEMADDV